ncbi:peptidylprolyl isomerase [Salinimonas sp. HHU 13199]|uniref:peptidylprolyl isomerase n=1 Tax=Salinimonas profundi TaxID=2729140 RepID=A0ABR8LL02_9ALTE|nr:peptidylprolyl isomerase [Salinimonas profundi]MBD3584982.1 peptidylprolyl isomerase [Salinimonas profundi]
MTKYTLPGFLLALLIALPLVASANDEDFYYTVPQSDLVYLQTNRGTVIIALTDSIAPEHVNRFKTLVKQRFYNNRYFYRVIEGFVAQAGTNGTHKQNSSTSPLPGEFTATSVEGFYEVERPAPFAPVTGFINGFPAATTPDRQRYWLTHCPGMVAMARDNKPNTGSTEFYIVLGQAPRHLDRNMSVFGRVVDGMEVLQQLPRGDRSNNGVLRDFSEDSELIDARLGEDIPASRRKQVRIQLPGHSEYVKKAAQARSLDNPFYADDALAPRPLDICYYQTDIEVK